MLTNQSGSPPPVSDAWRHVSCFANSARATSKSKALALSLMPNKLEGRVPYRLAA